MSESTESLEHAEQSASVSPHYSLVIEWSDEDQLYIVSFPEWEATGVYVLHTHGKTYVEAAQSGQEVLSDMLALAQEQSMPIPAPQTYASERTNA